MAAPDRGPRLWTVTIVTERGAAGGAARNSPKSSRRPATRHQGSVTVTASDSPTTRPTTTRQAPATTPTSRASSPTAPRPVAVPTQQAPPSPTIATLTIRHVSLDGARTSYEFVPVTVTPR
jgi:hypothetical protein